MAKPLGDLHGDHDATRELSQQDTGHSAPCPQPLPHQRPVKNRVLLAELTPDTIRHAQPVSELPSIPAGQPLRDNDHRPLLRTPLAGVFQISRANSQGLDADVLPT